MELKKALGMALRRARKSKQLNQEDLTGVSSQTYLSMLEGGVRGPTLEKIDAIASAMGVHPLTILADCYLLQDEKLTLDELFSRIRTELTIRADATPPLPQPQTPPSKP